MIFPSLQLKVHHISLQPPNKVVRNVFLKQIDLDALRCECACVCGVIAAWENDAVVVLTVMLSAPEAMAAQAVKRVIFIKTESQSCFILLRRHVYRLYKPHMGQMLFCFTLLNLTGRIYNSSAVSHCVVSNFLPVVVCEG